MMNWNLPVQAVDASSNLLVNRSRSRALNTDQYFPVTVLPYCHPEAENAKIQELTLTGRTENSAKHNPMSGLHLQFRFPPLTGKGITVPFFSQIKRHRTIVTCFGISKNFLEFPGKVTGRLILISFTQGAIVELQLYEIGTASP